MIKRPAVGRVKLYRNPKFAANGEKSIWLGDPLVARLPKVRGRVNASAVAHGEVASDILGFERRTGNSHIVVSQGRVDSYVSLVDPPSGDGRQGNALAIEGSKKVLARAFGVASFARSPERMSWADQKAGGRGGS